MWLGGWRDRRDFVCGIDFTHDYLRCLGLFLGKDRGASQGLNWKPLVPKIEKWTTRSLEVHGRAMVLNVFGLSKLWYVGHVLETGDKYLKKFESVMFQFVWQRSGERVARDIMVQSKEKGGVAHKLKGSRIKHVLDLIWKVELGKPV